jgi:sensor histidine kinase regulating citrate/malate metabolism
MKLNTLVTLMVCAIIGSVLLVVFALYSVQITRATRDDVKDTALGLPERWPTARSQARADATAAGRYHSAHRAVRHAT